MSKLIEIAQNAYQACKLELPEFKAGDTIRIYLKIQEKNKERIQQFQGTVIQQKGKTMAEKTFTVRKLSNGIAVERIFPLCLPSIQKIEVVRRGIVRRARLFYLRNKKGRAAKIKHKEGVARGGTKKSKSKSTTAQSVPSPDTTNTLNQSPQQ